MTDPNASSRIEAELARTKASLRTECDVPDILGGLSRDEWVTRNKAQPITDGKLLLIRSGPLVEGEVRSNVAAVRASIAARAFTHHTVSQCPRYDAWLIAHHPAPQAAREERV